MNEAKLDSGSKNTHKNRLRAIRRRNMIAKLRGHKPDVKKPPKNVVNTANMCSKQIAYYKALHDRRAIIVSYDYLNNKSLSLQSKGYPIPKYIQFCTTLLDLKYTVTLYEAKSTVSKYVTVLKQGYAPYKVRFSNHKPNFFKEVECDCDFFVGVSNLRTTNTAMALNAIGEFFHNKLNTWKGKPDDTAKPKDLDDSGQESV